MKANEPSFQNYLVKDGQAVPENPSFKYLSYYPPKDIDKDNWHKFETWKQSHTYATNAKDGCWPVGRFEKPVFQIQDMDGIWYEPKSGPNARYRIGIGKRQFAKFKEDVEKPKESENIVLDINDFAISLEDIERAFAYGYLANPENNCLDNSEMMRRYEIFKTEYLTPMLSRKGIYE